VWRPLRTDLRAIAKAGPDAWPGWLAERKPTAKEFAALLHAVEVLHVDRPAGDDEWTAIGGWLLEQARGAAVWSTDEWVFRWASFTLERPGNVPSGEVARACLAAVPTTLDELRAMPGSWRETPPDDVRRARMTRLLLRAAAQDAADPAVAAELERWRVGPGWQR
jgi:hypothetical protein